MSYDQKRTYDLYELNTYTLDISTIDLAVMCIASCEQHSEYLPFGTDGLIGEAVLRGAIEKSKVNVVMLPTQKIGFSPHHRFTPGYLTLSQTTFFHYLRDIVESVCYGGFKKLILLNSHGGNQSCIQTVINDFVSKNNYEIIAVRYWDLIKDAISAQRETILGGMGHAGEFEVSLMLHYYPDLVLKERIFDAEPATSTKWFNPDMFASNALYCYKPFDEYSKKGNVGQPQYGTTAKGKIYSDLIEANLAELLEWFALCSV